MNHIFDRLHPQELFDPHFRSLYQTCCDLHERGSTPDRNELLNELEDAELKQLVVVLEDWSHDKGILGKLEERDAQSELPNYLLKALNVFSWRREEAEHDRTRGEIAGYTLSDDQVAAGGELTKTDEELLARAMEFHKKRIQNKSTI
jgi:hypothetical protein